MTNPVLGVDARRRHDGAVPSLQRPQPEPVPVEVSELGKRYGDLVALERLSLTVAPGRIVGLIGPNGAGKSTAFRCILGFARPTEGEALVYGAPLPRPGDVRRRVGFTSQPAGLRPTLTVTRHLRQTAMSLQVDPGRVDVVVEQCGLSASRDTRIGNLSTGLVQRCSLATALLAGPSLLVLDEPANGLDAEGIRWLRHLLRGHADAGGAVLMSSHLLHELEQLADDVTILSRSVRWQGRTADLVGQERRSLEQAYFSLTTEEDGR